MSEKHSPEFMAGVQMITALVGMTLAFKQRFGDEAFARARELAGEWIQEKRWRIRARTIKSQI